MEEVKRITHYNMTVALVALVEGFMFSTYEVQFYIYIRCCRGVVSRCEDERIDDRVQQKASTYG